MIGQYLSWGEFYTIIIIILFYLLWLVTESLVAKHHMFCQKEITEEKSTGKKLGSSVKILFTGVLQFGSLISVNNWAALGLWKQLFNNKKAHVGLKALQVKCENTKTPWSGCEELSIPLPLCIFPKLWCSEGQKEGREDRSNDHSSALFQSYMLNFKVHESSWMTGDLYFSSMMGGWQGEGNNANEEDQLQLGELQPTRKRKSFFPSPEPFCSYRLLLFAPSLGTDFW